MLLIADKETTLTRSKPKLVDGISLLQCKLSARPLIHVWTIYPCNQANKKREVFRCKIMQ